MGDWGRGRGAVWTREGRGGGGKAGDTPGGTEGS